jgi:histidine triad (HIT) family protein
VIPNEVIPALRDVTAAEEPIMGRMLRVAADLAKEEGVSESGYRIILNCGDDGGQEVYHLHLHLLGGRPLGRMVSG